MSLYILCRIHCLPSKQEALTAALSNAMGALGIKTEFDCFENVEETELASEGYSWPAGIEFQLCDASDHNDATRLWNEALVASRKAIMDIQKCDPSNFTFDIVASMSLPEEYFASAFHTRLGRAIILIVNELGTDGGMIALVEGGVEKIEFCQAEQCLASVVRMFLLPWDCLSNTAYVWAASQKTALFNEQDAVTAAAGNFPLDRSGPSQRVPVGGAVGS